MCHSQDLVRRWKQSLAVLTRPGTWNVSWWQCDPSNWRVQDWRQGCRYRQTDGQQCAMKTFGTVEVQLHKFFASLAKQVRLATTRIGSNKSPTRCNNFPVYYPDVYLQLNMFWAFSRPSSGAQWLQWQHLILPSYRQPSARPRTQHDYHHDTKVKPEAATAVTELLMIGGKTPETC